MGANAKNAIEPLIDVFKNDIRNCQAHAAMALCSIAPTDPRVIAAAASEFEKGNPWALDALLLAGPAAKPLIPLLTQMLAADPKQSEIDPDAAIILGRIGPAASPAIPLLIKHMNARGLGNVSLLASACATALGQMGVANDEVISALILNATENDDIEVKRATIQALGNLGPPAKDALPVLRQILSNSNSTLRTDVVKAIEMIKGAKGMKAFNCECELRCRRGGLLRRLRLRRRHCGSSGDTHLIRADRSGT